MNTSTDIVIINCFETYEHRVELIKEYFLQQGKTVKVITSDWLHYKKNNRVVCPADYQLIHVRPYYKNLSLNRLLSHYDFARQVFRICGKESKILWVLVPPNSLVKYASKYKRRHSNVRLILDFIDMWPETMPITKFKSTLPFEMWKNLRDRYLNCADIIVTECGLYQQSLVNKKSKQTQMHTLYLAKNSAIEFRDVVLVKDKINLCYLGSINNIIDIPKIAEIISKIDLPVDLHIIGDGEKKEELINTAIAAGANVIFHGKIFDAEEKQEIFDQCHFGLNIMKDSVYVGLTMKSVDYFAGGLPIINNIKGDTWQFVDQYSIGLNYQSETPLTGTDLQEFQKKRIYVREFFNRYLSKDAFMANLDKIFDLDYTDK